MRKFALAVIVASFMLSGCSKFSPTSPSTVIDEPTGAVLDSNVLNNWSPYLHIHVTLEAYEAYDVIFKELSSNGRLRGIRVGLEADRYTSVEFVQLAKKYGLDVLGLVSANDYLNPDIDPDIEGRIERIYQLYPDVDYYQIGNEVTIGPGVNSRAITVDQYMEIFNRVRKYTRSHYPDKVLVTAAGFSGRASAGSFNEMISKGLLEGSNSGNLVISVNLYTSQEASYYGDVFRSNITGRFRVFVSESGVNNWDKQTGYVADEYRKIRAYVNAERIYWYTAWCGDSGGQEGFSLVRNIGRPYAWSPLYKALTGR